MLWKAATGGSKGWVERLTVGFLFPLEGFHFRFDVPDRTEVSSGQNLSHRLYVILKPCRYPAHKLPHPGSAPYGRQPAGGIMDANNCN